MKKIAFKNFRRFAEFPSIELGNISILVGRNNSGKSTMVKALLLIVDYLQNQQHNKFSFTNNSLEDANIVTFGRAKNNISESDQISFDFEIENYSFSIFIFGNDDDTTANVSKINVKDLTSDIIFDFDFNQETIKIVKLNKEITNKFDSFSDLVNERNEISLEMKSRDFYKKSMKGLRLLDRYNFLEEKIRKLGEKLNKEATIGFADEIFSKSYPLKTNLENITEDTILEELVSDFLYLNDAELRKLKEFRDKYTNEKNDNEATEKLLNKLITNDEGVYEQNKSNYERLEDLIQILVDIDNYKYEVQASINVAVKSLKKIIIYYLGANPSKQSALFSLRDKNNSLAQAIHDFKQSKITEGEPEYNFVKYWMNEFEVGVDFKIEFYAGEAYEFYVFDKEENKAHLADKGMGSLQAMMLILRVATILRKHKNTLEYVTLIIEEPELNLHPALQGELTRFFHDVNKEFKINFIVETHSEYLIRKSQNILVKEEYSNQEGLNPNPFKLYYFDIENGPYEMKYQMDGKFDRKFGTGFFNYSDELEVETYKLNLQKNK